MQSFLQNLILAAKDKNGGGGIGRFLPIIVIAIIYVVGNLLDKKVQGQGGQKKTGAEDDFRPRPVQQGTDKPRYKPLDAIGQGEEKRISDAGEEPKPRYKPLQQKPAAPQRNVRRQVPAYARPAVKQSIQPDPRQVVQKRAAVPEFKRVEEQEPQKVTEPVSAEIENKFKKEDLLGKKISSADIRRQLSGKGTQERKMSRVEHLREKPQEEVILEQPVQTKGIGASISGYENLRQAIIFSEIIGKPLALRFEGE